MNDLIPTPWKPTTAQLAAAAGKKVPDIIAPDLKVLFVGINPGLYSGAIGRHFARPGNRFWPALKAGGFTDRILSPWDVQELLDRGLGITNFVERATAAAAELSQAELIKGGRVLAGKIERYHPRIVAMLGIGAYRSAFHRPDARLGRQGETIAGSHLWVLPNPSGLNAHYNLQRLGELFAEVRACADTLT